MQQEKVKRDASGAILNTDDEGLSRYKAGKQKALEHRKLIADMDQVKADVVEIKLGIKQILEILEE